MLLMTPSLLLATLTYTHIHNTHTTAGDYDTYERTRAERSRHHDKALEAQETKRKHVQQFIDKFR